MRLATTIAAVEAASIGVILLVSPALFGRLVFGLLATPMAALLSTLDPHARDQAIEAVTLRTKAFLDLDCTRDGRFTFPQEAYVVSARSGTRQVQ